MKKTPDQIKKHDILGMNAQDLRAICKFITAEIYRNHWFDLAIIMELFNEKFIMVNICILPEECTLELYSVKSPVQNDNEGMFFVNGTIKIEIPLKSIELVRDVVCITWDALDNKKKYDVTGNSFSLKQEV